MAEYRSNGWWQLTGMQRAFVEAWFSNGYNATEAARSAGYGGEQPSEVGLRVQGSRNLTNANIQAVIKEMWAAKCGMVEEEVTATLADQIRADFGDLLDEDGRICPARVKELGHLVKSFSITPGKYGETIRVELYDKQRAAELLGKSMGMFRDVIEHEGQVVLVSDGNPGPFR